MSYINVEIGGKQRGLKFNKMAQLIIEQKIIADNLMSGVYAVVYAGLKANCYVKGVEPDFTFEDVCDWTDGLEDSIILQITEAFKDTEMYKKGQSYQADLAAAKKKETQKSKVSKNKEKTS